MSYSLSAINDSNTISPVVPLRSKRTLDLTGRISFGRIGELLGKADMPVNSIYLQKFVGIPLVLWVYPVIFTDLICMPLRYNLDPLRFILSLSSLFMIIWVESPSNHQSIVYAYISLSHVRKKFLQREFPSFHKGELPSEFGNNLSAQFHSYHKILFVSLTFVTISIPSLARVVAIVCVCTLSIVLILFVISHTTLNIPIPITKIQIRTSKRVNAWYFGWEDICKNIVW